MEANQQEREKQYLNVFARLIPLGLLRLGESEAQRLPSWTQWRLSTEGTHKGALMCLRGAGG